MTGKKAPLPAPSGEARIAIRLTAVDHVRLNILRAPRQQTLQSLVREAVNEWLSARDEKPLETLQP